MSAIKYRARTENGDPDPIDIHVGMRLRSRRTFLGFSQGELAKAVNLTFQQVQKYENGHNRISASRLFHIAKFLGVPVSFFFEGFDSAHPATEFLVDRIDPETKRETLEMMRNYHRIHDPEVRNGLHILIQSLIPSN